MSSGKEVKRPGATHVALCDSVGSYFRHWCGAFTLAEVLVTLYWCCTAGICSSTLEVQRVNSSCVGQTWPAGCFGRILNDNWQMTY